MTQAALSFDRPASNTAIVADYFKQRQGQWISALELARIGGLLSSRTRISECRKAPYFMHIEQRNERRGRTILSFYRYVVTK